MGVALSSIIQGQTISIKELSGKTFVVDAFNMLYQFITTIRSPDGSPLTDSDGRVTSHLVGLFNRCTKLMQEGLKLVFVFDGVAPELKKAERQRRKELKMQAQKAYDKAVEEQDEASMAKYAGRTARLTSEMIQECKQLLDALGIPYVQAPSEGEAQAAYMVDKGDAWALISQDYDSLLFGTSRMIKNLSVTARRKKPGAYATTAVEPELLTLSTVLNGLGMTRDQLIYLGMLIGTDFNIGGIKGLGQKKGLKLVKECSNGQELFGAAKWSEFFDFDWQEVYQLFKEMPTTDDYDLTWAGVDEKAVKKILVEDHNFSLTRVETILNKLIKSGQDRAQKGLGDFF